MIRDWDLWPGIIAVGAGLPGDTRWLEELFQRVTATISDFSAIVWRFSLAMQEATRNTELLGTILAELWDSVNVAPDNGPSPDWDPEQMIGDRG